MQHFAIAASALLAVATAQPAAGVSLQLWARTPNAASQSFDLLADAHIAIRSSDEAVLVWDIPSGANATGTPIALADSSTTSPTQQWAYHKDIFLIRSTYNNMCAAAVADVEGLGVVLTECNANDTMQQFAYNATSGVFTFMTDVTLCIDAGTPALNCSVAPLNTFPYCNTSLAPSDRAADLVARLTVFDIAPLLVKQVNNGVPRLGIPQIRFNEALHGIRSNCGPTYTNQSTGYTSSGCPTSFPHALAMGSSFNRTLWSLVAGTIATEGRAIHNTITYGLLTFAPDVNPFRDPRWGRGQEVPGEDAHLNGEYVNLFARGFQEGEDPRYIRLVSTTKHFSCYDLEMWDGFNRMRYDAVVTLQDLVQYYWVPFVSAVQRGHVHGIMCSYNAETVIGGSPSVNNVPSCANGYFNNDILRTSFGFDGYVVSDCSALTGIYDQHKYVSSYLDAAIAAMNAGVDVECGVGIYAQYLPTALQQGNVTLDQLRTAAYRLMNVVFALGLVDPYNATVYNTYGPERVDTAANRALALEAATQGIILLQNYPTSKNPWTPGVNATLLPLRQVALKRVAVIGPNANVSETLLSNYHGDNTIVNSYTPLLSLTGRLGAAVVTYAPGCADVYCNTTDGFAAAVSAASTADIALMFMGLDDTQEHEGLDRVNLTLPGSQLALIQAIVATGTPVVVVLIHGGALAIEWTQANVPAILSAHYPGELGGLAVTQVLFGDVSPSGRTTVTWYPADFVNERNMTDMQLSNGTGLTYLYYTGPTLWPFGFGLSYTTFQFTWMDSSAELRMDAAGPAPPPVAVNVTNTGTVASDVSALAFVSSGVPGQPLQELFDFQRAAAVAPGQTVTLYFTLPPDVLALVNPDGSRVVEPGAYTIRIGDVPRDASVEALQEGRAAGAFVETTLHVEGERHVLPAWV